MALEELFNSICERVPDALRAGLVLAAWYLMIPPHLSQNGDHVMSLSRWTIAQRFFTEQN